MGDLLFVGSCNGVLHGVDRRTGDARWTYNAASADGGKPEFHGSPLVTDELVVIASDDRRPDGIGYLYAFKRPSLDLAWKRRIGAGAMTDIVQFDDTVYVVTLDDELLALDLHSGAVRWRLPSEASNEPFARSSTPAVAGDRLIFAGLNGVVLALSVRSGTVLWRRDIAAPVSTSIAIVADDVFLGDSNGRVHRLDASTGASEAELRLDGSAHFRMVPVDRSLLVFVNQSGITVLKSLPLALEAARWTQAAPPPGWTSLASPYVWKNWVVVGSESGELVAFRLVDGRREWSGKVSGAIAAIAGDESALYVGTVSGRLYGYALPSEWR